MAESLIKYLHPLDVCLLTLDGILAKSTTEADREKQKKQKTENISLRTDFKRGSQNQ